MTEVLEPRNRAHDLSEVLLDAKLSVPQVRGGVVSRAAIIEMARSSARPVVAVTAPAGYGKTTFLAEWANRDDRAVVWVSLDSLDNDPALLLTALAAAYRRLDPSRVDLDAAMGGSEISVLGQAAPRLAAAFASSPVPFVLFLDDLHELQNPMCHDVLEVLIGRVPPGSQVVKASRSAQPHIARLRTSGSAIEFGPDDLALDEAGVQEVFWTERVSLSQELAVSVVERTEGWPVGIYLAAVIARESDGEVETITGDHRYVTDYLYQESLLRQPEEVRHFLRCTSVLDQLHGPLCDAVLASTGGTDMLQHLESVSLFLIPRDRRREWYRYHALFREFLLGELQRAEPEIVESLHLRAANWYEINGSPSLALEHLLQTTETHRTARLMDKLHHPSYLAGQFATSLRWLSTINDANIEAYPPLAVLAAWGGVLSGDTVAAERWAAFVDGASFDEKPADDSASFDSGRAQLRAGMCAGGPEPMRLDAELAVAQEPSWSRLRDNALWLLGEAHLLLGDVEASRHWFEASTDCAAALGGTDSIVISQAELAILAMDSNEWIEAADHLELAQATIEQMRIQDYLICLLAYAGAARLALHRGQKREAEIELAKAMRGRPLATHVLPFIAVRLRAELAKVYWAMGNPTAANHLLREVDEIMLRRPALGVLVDQVKRLRRSIASGSHGVAGAPPLSPAELRMLPYLQTHLTLAAIAERLFISRSTVNSQVTSIYRKFGVSSRQAAVEKATTMGLLGG